MKAVFFVAGAPAPKGSMRAFKSRSTGRMVMTSDNPRAAAWEATVKLRARRELQAPLGGEVGVALVFVLPATTRGDQRRSSAAMHGTGDIDKLTRAVFDGLNGVAFEDDSRVTWMKASKRLAKPGEQTGVRITVEQLGQQDLAVGGPVAP